MLYYKIDCFKFKVSCSGFKTHQILKCLILIMTKFTLKWAGESAAGVGCDTSYIATCYTVILQILHNINVVTVFQCHHHIIIRIGYNCLTKLVYNWISVKTVTVSSLWKCCWYYLENERAIHESMKLHKISYLSRKTKLFSCDVYYSNKNILT